MVAEARLAQKIITVRKTIKIKRDRNLVTYIHVRCHHIDTPNSRSYRTTRSWVCALQRNGGGNHFTALFALVPKFLDIRPLIIHPQKGRN